MVRSALIIVALLALVSCSKVRNAGKSRNGQSANYINNRIPLVQKPFISLPLGTIKPKGWLLQQLEIMRDGLTGNLDKRYPSVVGPRNGWLGGDGDGWERGPYWIDGLLPLAYILDDDKLKAKVKPWIEWSLTYQADSGYFGPIPFREQPTPEPGIQKGPREDWWPKMVMLKVLKQYYEATRDQRVIELLTKYFKYQLKTLPQKPLDNWSFWANRRGGDNLLVVYWLYNITGDKFLLDLAELIHKQTFPYTEVFLNQVFDNSNDLSQLYPNNTGNKYPFNQELIKRLSVNQLQSFHCVNFAQGIKEPLIYYQQHPDYVYVRAVTKALEDIRIFHGQPQGMYGGDEPLHGRVPTQGIEFCSVVELMYSLENMITILGDVQMADHLEKIAYNALPTHANDDFTMRQYFQTANQVLITRHRRNSYEEDYHHGTDLCYGLLTGYPCCTCNMHQGWPKFTQNLWYASDDHGVATIIYAPSEVHLKVADGKNIKIEEKTNYPFDNKISFVVHGEQALDFPFYLRIPGWCSEATVLINGNVYNNYKGNQIVKISREWENKDVLELQLPMHIEITRWFENSVAVQRGPLVYALKIGEEWKFVKNDDKYGDYYEIYPQSPWNYGLLEDAIEHPETGFQVIENSKQEGKYPWNLENAPLYLKTAGKRMPEWTLYNQLAGPLPHSRPWLYLQDQPADSIVLVPYGCTTLRITEFPVVR